MWVRHEVAFFPKQGKKCLNLLLNVTFLDLSRQKGPCENVLSFHIVNKMSLWAAQDHAAGQRQSREFRPGGPTAGATFLTMRWDAARVVSLQPWVFWLIFSLK